MGATTFAVLVEPRPQTGPLTDEGFMGELDRSVVDREQPSVGEHPDKPIGGDASRLLGQLGDRDATSSVLGALTELGQTEEDLTGALLLCWIEPTVDRFRGLRDRATDPARIAVAGDCEGAMRPALPGLEQRVGQQRQPA